MVKKLKPRKLAPGEMLEAAEAPEGVRSEPITVEGPEPNIQFVGRNAKGEIREAPVWRRDGPKEFHLPDSDTQISGWYSDEADDLIRAWPHDFKRPVKKGAKK
jgi:hypothetical protein